MTRLSFLGAALICLVGCAGQSSPQESLRTTFLKANSGNYSGANAGFIDELREAFERLPAAVRTRWDQFTRKGTIAKIEFMSVETQGESSMIHYKITYKDGDTLESDEVLSKVGGTWKMSVGSFLTATRPEQ
jgi:hypothetical protein